MTTALATTPNADAIEAVIAQGDLSKLNPAQRTEYYRRVCDSLRLNPLTKPFGYLSLNGKLVLYALKDCTEQLRTRDTISVKITGREVTEGVCVVTAQASTPAGRTDESIGAVLIDGTKGEARANAMMKAETKAKRRVTLSICGLGIVDESEVESIQGARVVDPDTQAGPIVTQPAVATHEPKALPAPADDAETVAALFAEISTLTGVETCLVLQRFFAAAKWDVDSLEHLTPEQVATACTSARSKLAQLKAQKGTANAPG